jgi:hypothetical protein
MICHDSLFPNGPAAGSGGRRRVRETRSWKAAFAVFATALFYLAGCSTEDPRLQSLREQFVLRAEPQQPTTIADAKTKVAENPRVEFVGRIAKDEFDAFTPGQASFLVTEILPDEPGHGGKDHAENCPFCKRKAAEAPRAVVHLVDAAGETLKVDARKLFGIESGDTVVIRGTGELMAELDLFVVTADGIYVRRSEGGH